MRIPLIVITESGIVITDSADRDAKLRVVFGDDNERWHFRRTKRGRVRFSWRCAALVSILVGMGCDDHTPTHEAAMYNVVLVSIDTLRPDHLGCYGYHRATSPELDRFRADAVLFTDAIAHASSTLASHASLFSSLLPQHHGAGHTHGRPLPEAIPTLAEELRMAGWRTAAFTGLGQLSPEFGLDQGFEVYDAGLDRFDRTVERAIDWLQKREQRNEPFFVFLHTYDAHHPYSPAPALLKRMEGSYDGRLPDSISIALIEDINAGRRELTEADLAHVIAAYDAGIVSVDTAFGELIRFLQQQDLYDETLIVFTSDHGEELGEHGMVGWHSHTLFQELLRVPLLIKLPGASHAGATMANRAPLIDVAPTILGVLGRPTPDSFSGRSLFPAAPHPPSRVVVSHQHLPTSELQAVMVEEWKWIDGRLFNLAEDPGELNDIAGEHPAKLVELAAKLDEILAERSTKRAPSITPDPETRDSLRSLGYIQ